MEEVLQLIVVMEETHREVIDELQIRHEKHIQRLEEIHDSAVKSVRLQLDHRLEETDTRIEALSKTLDDRSSVINGTRAAEDGRNSKPTFEAMANKMNELQAQGTILK